MRALPLFVMAALTSACTSVAVDSDHEGNADFSTYRSFDFLHAAGAAGVNNEIVDRRIRASLERGLAAEGLARKTGGADLMVAYRVGVRDRLVISDWGYPYRYWRGFGRVRVTSYREGTFVLDLVEARSKRLVWRGWATDVMGGPSPSAEEVDRVVTALLEEYPPAR